ncbi:MAG: helix-turn-helix domain-containing protein [Cyanobacteria bacterium SZAS TMP-1]|nr:helix-turn-helix domain-containing protein [Cyanobacteria bacterium SZAS TMP-1]
MAPATFLANESEWLTSNEAAEMLGCSRQHVVELIHTGKLKATKRGTECRIWLPDLMQFIDADDKVRETAFRKLIAQTEEFDGYLTSAKKKTL